MGEDFLFKYMVTSGEVQTYVVLGRGRRYTLAAAIQNLCGFLHILSSLPVTEEAQKTEEWLTLGRFPLPVNERKNWSGP